MGEHSLFINGSAKNFSAALSIGSNKVNHYQTSIAIIEKLQSVALPGFKLYCFDIHIDIIQITVAVSTYHYDFFH